MANSGDPNVLPVLVETREWMTGKSEIDDTKFRFRVCRNYFIEAFIVTKCNVFCAYFPDGTSRFRGPILFPLNPFFREPDSGLHAGLERIRLLHIALHSAIRSRIILAILFAIQIAILIALAIRLQSNTLSIVLSTRSTR